MIAVLVGRVTDGTLAANESVGQKRLFDGVVELFDVSLDDEACRGHLRPDLLTQHAILRAVRAAVVVEHDVEVGKVPLVGLLHLGNDLLFAATWLYHRGLAADPRPPGWMRVLDSELMAQWNRHQNTVGVLPSDLWAHPRFTVWARHDGDRLTGGAILHDAGRVAGLSNTWSAENLPLDPSELLALAARAHPGRAVVDYARGAELESMLATGFEPLGPHHVWIR